MRKFLAALCAFAVLCLPPPSDARSLLMSDPLPSTAGGNLTALDGSVQGAQTGSGTTCTATITTTQTNDFILAYVSANSASNISAGPVFSGGGLSWTTDTTVANPNTQIDALGFAVAASTLSSQTITATLPATISYCTLIVVAISGANTGSPFDGSALTGVAGFPLSLTTTNANDFIFAGFGANVASPTAGACCTLLFGAQFQGAEYKIVTTTQSGLGMDGTPSGPRAMIVRAIKSN